MGSKLKKGIYFIIRIVLVLLGISLLSFSIAALFWVGLGSDPTSVCVDGIHQYFGLSHGIASSIVNIGLLVLLLLIRRSQIGIATVIASFLIGPIIDLFQKLVFNPLPQCSHLLLGLVIVCAAVFVNAAGLGLYLSMGLGASAFDGIILTMSDVFSLSYGKAMYIFYSVIFLIGLILGGVWGVGTIISLALCGWFFENTFRFFSKSLSFLVKA